MSDELRVTGAGGGIAAAAGRASKGGAPAPVHLWDPPFCGDMDLTIRADGTWIHEGTPIGRPALVRLFANVLKREGDDYFLVTPVEKLGIRVEDVPFRALDLDAAGGALTFTTDMDERVTAGPDHPLRIAETEAGPVPYLHVRGPADTPLEARVDRKTFYRLMELGEVREVNGEEWFGLASGGAFFAVIRAAELP
jgi:hypothetical protein